MRIATTAIVIMITEGLPMLKLLDGLGWAGILFGDGKRMTNVIPLTKKYRLRELSDCHQARSLLFLTRISLARICCPVAA